MQNFYSLLKKALLLFVFCFTFLFSQLTEYQDKIVKDIIVTGNKVTKKDLIIKKSGVKVNEKVTYELIKNIIKQLHGLRLFEDIKVNISETGENEVILNLLVKERIRINKVIFVR